MGDWTDDRDFLITRLLDQNDKLIDALVAASPVEVVKALNPPQVAPIHIDPWRDDAGHTQAAEDPWGDPDVPFASLTPGDRTDGWVDPPFATKSPESTQNDAPAPTPE